MSYFNTTHLTGDVLAIELKKAATWDERILNYFRDHPKGFLATPEDVHEALTPDVMAVPITNTRRSMSVLTAQGLLEKTDTMSPGFWGKPIHNWRLAGGSS